MSIRLTHLAALYALCLGASPLLANEAKEPYQVRIVLDVAKHRLLTDVFRKQLERELNDGLQTGLGDLARVQVTNDHPLLPKIRTEGLGKALNDYRARSPERACFVLVDFSGTHYNVQTRMHDGLTGLPSPVVRKGRTHDRAYVARIAAFLLERDIGLLGTIATEPDAATKQVRLDLKGGGLGVDLAKWVKKGEVFQILRGEGAGPSQLEESAYLQVIEPARDGSCVCKLFSRRKLSRVVDLRAVLLGTRSGPLRLRVMQEKEGGGVGPLSSPVTLELRKNGFEGEESSKLQQTPLRGEVNTANKGEPGLFDRLAFISVKSGDTLRARVPVAILDDSSTLLVVPAASEADDLIIANFKTFGRNVREALNVQNMQFERINKLTQNPDKRSEALAVVRKSLERGRTDHTELMKERDEVSDALKKLSPREQPPATEMQKIDERLEKLKSGEKELLNIVKVLEEFEKDENDPTKKDWRTKIEGAKLLEKEAEIGKALAIYEKVPADMVTKDLENHIKGLKTLWTPKDAKHKEAREFIYNVWPGLDTPGLKDRMKEARDSFDACEKVRDTLGPVKMRNAMAQHISRMDKDLEELKPDVNNEDEKQAKLIKEVVLELQKLDGAIKAFLDKNK